MVAPNRKSYSGQRFWIKVHVEIVAPGQWPISYRTLANTEPFHSEVVPT